MYLNWDAIGAIGELIGAIAVVVTLAYLAVQVRYTKASAADSSRTSRANGVRETLQLISSDSQLRKNWIASSGLETEYERLSKSLNTDVDGAFQIDFLCQSWVWLHWGQFSSTTTNDDLEELQRLIGLFYSNPPMSICWNEGPFDKGLVEDKLVQFVNEAVARQKKKRAAVDA